MKPNIYQQLITDFDKIPKAVLGAIVVSVISAGGDYLNEEGFDVNEKIIEEWHILHRQGIVPQKPIKILTDVK